MQFKEMEEEKKKFGQFLSISKMSNLDNPGLFYQVFNCYDSEQIKWLALLIFQRKGKLIIILLYYLKKFSVDVSCSLILDLLDW
jgi:hypothetical protein